MFSSCTQVLAIVCFSITVVQSAKILAIFPFPGPSQYIVVQPLLKALAARGHELTVISHFPQKQKITNFYDIKLEYPNYYEGVINKIIELGDGPETEELFLDFFKNVTVFTLEHNEVQRLLKSDEIRFDLVVIEALLTEALYAIGPHFKAPLIGLSSFGTDPTIDELVGNASPISYLPLVRSALTDRMNFWQRLENFQLIFSEWLHTQRDHMPVQQEIYEKYFPHLEMKLEDVQKNFSLILLNQHFSLSFPRPYVPAMVEVGGMHINHKPAPLPKDMADFIKGAKDGVIYFSMGSNVRTKDFPAEKIQTLLRVFGDLKQRVMWKFELTELPGKPENVFISKWFPQPDILAHPNVKLFVTHAGLLSTIEAIHHAKPIVGIPVFYDQFLNMERAKLAGFGVGIDFYTFKESHLRSAIQEVLNNASYTKVVQEISARYHDQPIKPLDKAVYWVEYVLRHKGALHMRVAAQDLSFIAYHSIDIWCYLFIIWIILPLVAIFIAYKLIYMLLKSSILEHQKSKHE